MIPGDPIYSRFWATDLSGKERGKVVPSKRVPRSPCEPDFPGCLYDLGLNRGDEEKWFRKENVPGKLFIAELEGLPASP
jgi:hypothetical protein